MLDLRAGKNITSGQTQGDGNETMKQNWIEMLTTEYRLT